jgi:hypothetical protein
LRGGKAARVFFEPLDAKQLGPDRSFIVPWRERSTCSPKRQTAARSALAGKVINLEKHGLTAPST